VRTFQIENCLGKGGFGEVYRAMVGRQGGLQSQVALKVLRTGLNPAGQAIQRLRDEARLLARLNHPTILKVFDLVVLDGRVSLVAEYVPGQDLGECMVADPPLSHRALLESVAQVSSALHLAWTGRLLGADLPLRIVHRDIKPSNIRISCHGQVKLLDFGIARTDSIEREACTQTDLMMGSPAYMAPERFLRMNTHPASDVFGLGCTMYEGLADLRLFHKVPVIGMSAMALDGESFSEFIDERLGLLPSHIPADVVEVLKATLRYEPDERPTAGELMRVLEALADQMSGLNLRRWCRRRDWPEPKDYGGPLSGRTLHEMEGEEEVDSVTRAFLIPDDSDVLMPGPKASGTSSSVKRRVVGDPTLVSAATSMPKQRKRPKWLWLAQLGLAFLLLVLGAAIATVLFLPYL